jgi:hypothetical protein
MTELHTCTPLTDEEVAQARRDIAVKLASAAKPENKNIGPSGAWERAKNVIVPTSFVLDEEGRVVSASGPRAHDRIKILGYGLLPQNRGLWGLGHGD